uniref:Uncharacterized protein n=1 Tax=Anguilla anguilla TaxID=7936 RepID=A0A0E9RFG3_ANGAN
MTITMTYKPIFFQCSV